MEAVGPLARIGIGWFPYLLVRLFYDRAPGWAEWALAATWQLAALALLALVCEKLFRLRQPRVRYALWWFVLVAPLLLTPGRMLLARREAAVQVVGATALVKVAAVSLAPPPFPAQHYPNSSVPADVFASPEYQAGLREHSFRQLWCFLAFLAWLFGAVAMALRLLGGYRRVAELMRRCQPVQSEAAARVLTDCAPTVVRICESDAAGAPVLCGVLRPAIIVPPGWLETMEEDDLRALLAHEVAHIRRRDVLANLLQRLLEVPLFFHPFAWLASRRITLAREELADAWALTRGTAPEAYARALATAAERANGGLAGAAVGIAESKSALRRRVEAIVRGTGLHRLRWPAAAALVALVLGLSAAAVAVKLTDAESAAVARSTAPVTPIYGDQPLSAREMESVLSEAGIGVDRLSYEFDRPHTLEFTYDEYRDGALVSGTVRSNSIGMAAGRHTLMIVTRLQGDQLSLLLSTEGGGGTGTSFVTSAEGARTQGIYQGGDLKVGESTPIYFFATDREGVGGATTIAEMQSRYDHLIVVRARIVPGTDPSLAPPSDAAPASPGRVLKTPVRFRAEEGFGRFNETDIALSKAGIRSHRFTYFASAGHMLFFTVKVYRHGRQVDTIGGNGDGGSTGGALQFLLFEHRTKGALSLSYAAGNDHGYTSIDPLPAISLEGIGSSSAYVAREQDLTPGKECPVWVLLGHDQGRTSTRTESWDGSPRLDRYIRTYELVAVAYLRLEPMPGSASGTRRRGPAASGN